MLGLAERIKTVREKAGLSQTAFAAKIGVSRSAVNKIESGENNPAERTIRVIASEFNVNYDWLTKGEGEMFQEESSNIELIYRHLRQSSPKCAAMIAALIQAMGDEGWDVLDKAYEEAKKRGG